MHRQAYYLRDEDTWHKINYEQKAETWMKPLTRGNETGLVEIPGNWYLDDLPPLMWVQWPGVTCGILKHSIGMLNRFPIRTDG